MLPEVAEIKRGFRSLGRFLRRVHTVSLLTGIVLGVPFWWLVQLLLDQLSLETGKVFELGLGVVLGALAGWLLPTYGSAIHKEWKIARPLRAVLAALVDDDEEVTVFLAPLFPAGTEFRKIHPLEAPSTAEMTVTPALGIPWVLAEGDARALGYIQSILGISGRLREIRILRDDQGLTESLGNLFCLGGPRSNLKTRQILKIYERTFFRFTGENYTLIEEIATGKKWEGRKGDIDYGILVKTANQFDRGKWAFIAAGLGPTGTLGVAFFLWKNWKWISDNYWSEPFGLLLEVAIADYHSAKVAHVATHPRRPNQQR